MRRLATALGLAVAAATAAQAQTVIERQISSEPVETVITRNLDGTTTITRRPLGPNTVVTAPAPVLAAPVFPNPFAPLFAAPAPTMVETVETVEQPTTTVVTREVVRPRTVTRTVEPVRRASTVRASERRLSPAVRESYAMAYSPAQREVIYRSIVAERPVVTREVVGAPMRITPTVTTVASTPVTVGSTLSRDAIIYEMPADVVASVPAVRTYGYTLVGDRVLLVDPASRVIVDDLSY
jgi:hypothetical protein